MKENLQKFAHILRSSIPILISLLLFILILKQLSLYDRLLGLYHALFPIFGGALIAFLLQPIIERLQPWLSHKAAVICVYAGILFFFGALLLVLLPILYRQLIDFLQLLPTWVEKIESFLTSHHIVLDQYANYQTMFMEEGTSFVLTSVTSFLTTAADYGIAYITAFFLSIDLAFWKRSARKLFPNYHRFVTFYKTMSNIVFQYLSGTLLDLSFVAITSFVILTAADFPNALLYAILLALSNLFPYIGPTIGLIFVVLVSLLSYDQLPLITLGLLWIDQQIEANFIQPMIFNKTMDVRPILSFVALFIGEALFGIPGVLLSPIFASILQIGFRSYLHAKTKDTVGKWEDIWYDFDEAMKQIPVPQKEEAQS